MELPAPVSNDFIFQKLSPYTDVVMFAHKHRKFKISKHRDLHIGNYTLAEVLGPGRIGDVRLAYGPNLDPVVINLVPRSSLDAHFVERLSLEIQVLNDLEHPHVMQLNSVFIDGDYFGIVMDHASKGDVHKYLSEHGRIEEDKAKRWFAQLVSAVDKMHTQCYAHRDIKPENLLIDAEDNILLTDFELCESFQRQGFPYVNSVCGTPTFCCPEAVLSAAEYNICKADIWSLGITLFVLVAGYHPFDDAAFPARTKAELAELYYHIQITPLRLPKFLSPDLADLLRCLLAKNPEERITLADVKRHCWLEEYQDLLLNPECTERSRRTSRRSSRFGSWSSTSSLQTLNDRMAECTKQVRGPIIWDPDAGFMIPY